MTERTLKPSTRWSYALGNNGFFIAMTLYTTYPLVFMTSCLGLKFPLAIKILTWAKIFDIIASLMTGTIIEKVNMRWGKYRSWFLIGPIIAGIGTCLLFSPLLTKVSPTFIFPLGVFLIVLWNAASNIVLTCHNAMNAVLTHNQMERISIFKLSNQLQAVTGAIAGFFMMKIVFAVGGEQTVNLKGMQVIGIIYSLLYFILYYVLFINLKDYNDDKTGAVRQVSILDTLKLLATNGKVAALTVSGMFSLSADTFFRAVAPYYFLYVIFSAKMLDTFNWTIVVAAFVGATLAMPIAKSISKKGAYMLGYLIMAAGLMGAYFTSSTPYVALGSICIAFVGLNFARSVFVPMYSDISDLILYETGENVASYVMAAYNLNFKVAGFIAARAYNLLARVGFVTGVDPIPEVSRGISAVATLGPVAFAFISLIIMLVFYRLDEKQMPKIQAELRACK